MHWGHRRRLKTKIPDGDCCCNRSAGVTFVEIAGRRVGLTGIEELFRGWQKSGLEPSSLSAAEVLAGVRNKNYESTAVEDLYVEALRIRYSAWLKVQAGGEWTC